MHLIYCGSLYENNTNQILKYFLREPLTKTPAYFPIPKSTFFIVCRFYLKISTLIASEIQDIN